MKTIFIKLISLCMIAFILMGCGQRVEVPAAHIGKIMTKHGYKEGYYPTSKFRLDFCVVYCDKLVLLNVGDFPVTEPMKLFMPQDRLNMSFDLRMTLSVNPTRYDELFNRVSPQVSDKGDFIPLSYAYEISAQQIIRSEMRSFLSEFTITEILSSRDSINALLSDKLTEVINERTPFIVRYAGLADIEFPPVIVQAQENAAERREMIQQEEAQLEISKVQLERELQEQRLQRAIDVERAEAEAQVNRILAESVTPEYITYRNLNALDSIARSQNKVFVPNELLSSMAGQVMLGNQ